MHTWLIFLIVSELTTSWRNGRPSSLHDKIPIMYIQPPPIIEVTVESQDLLMDIWHYSSLRLPIGPDQPWSDQVL